MLASLWLMDTNRCTLQQTHSTLPCMPPAARPTTTTSPPTHPSVTATHKHTPGSGAAWPRGPGRTRCCHAPAGREGGHTQT